MNFDKIKKVVLGLILLFTIYKTVNYLYAKIESIKYYFINQEVKKISAEYNKIISSLVAEWKNNLAFLEADNTKTLQELSEVKEDNIKTHQKLVNMKNNQEKTHQKLVNMKNNQEKTHQELAEIKEAMKSIMNLMQKGLT